MRFVSRDRTSTPLGSTSAYVSPEMIIVRGDKVMLTLENRLGLSSTSMRATVD